MNRKNFSFLLLSFVLITFCAETTLGQRGQRERQEREERHEQIEARRIAFITNELSLTPSEAQKFWPVYNEYNQKRAQMMARHRQQRMNLENLENLTEQQLLELADADIVNMEEMISLRREYHEKFKKILPLKKVIQLYEAEREFNRTLFRESRGAQRPAGRGRN